MISAYHVLLYFKARAYHMLHGYGYDYILPTTAVGDLHASCHLRGLKGEWDKLYI